MESCTLLVILFYFNQKVFYKLQYRQGLIYVCHSVSAATVANVLEEDALQLYTLIWARTMACQLEPAVSSQVWMRDIIMDHLHLIHCISQGIY